MNWSKRIVTTSWDDGHLMDEKLASLLMKYGIKGTFYFSKCFVEKYGIDDLVKRLDKNFEIGAHTVTHRNLLNVTIQQAVTEIKESKKWLEELLHHRVDMFCYPYGKYNEQIIELVKKANFIGVRSLKFDIMIPKNPYVFGVGCHASNGSPLMRLKSSLKFTKSLKSIIDWKVNAIKTFDYVLKNGGVWHLWGHSWEIEQKDEWEKLEDVLRHVSGKENVYYLENGQVIRLMYSNTSLG
jgi:peptidoglycan/xylan/chitin deacetylase (PgdA/CDA1 family)